MNVVEVTENKGALCAEILAALPHWFGIAESNTAYIRNVEAMPMFAVFDGAKPLGFVALGRPTPSAVEIHVLGVRPELHRSGVGRELIARAEAFARAAGVPFLTVKTLSSRDPDEGYARTRAFYTAMGFLAIDELPGLWSPDNPAVIMLKVLR
jgi:GNAT superfamily N-acetyltransferase